MDMASFAPFICDSHLSSGSCTGMTVVTFMVFTIRNLEERVNNISFSIFNRHVLVAKNDKWHGVKNDKLSVVIVNRYYWLE